MKLLRGRKWTINFAHNSWWVVPLIVDMRFELTEWNEILIGFWLLYIIKKVFLYLCPDIVFDLHFYPYFMCVLCSLNVSSGSNVTTRILKSSLIISVWMLRFPSVNQLILSRFVWCCWDFLIDKFHSVVNGETSYWL